MQKWRKFTAFFLMLLLWGLTAVSTQAQSNDIYILEIEAPVTPIMLDYFERGIQEAEDQNAHAVIIMMDTPGGLVDVTLDIVELFRNSDMPIIMYVGPAGAQAASAGSVITAASHVAAMAPNTVIGAASPINGDGSDINETAYRKAVEDLKAVMRSLTSERGDKAVELAESMIEDARAVTSDEALEAGFIDLIAQDVDALLTEIDGMTVQVNGEAYLLETANARQTAVPLTGVEQALFVLTSPELLGLLLTVGLAAIVFEVRNPGFGISGALGILCIALALFGLNQLPVNWFGMGLVVAAFVFFLIEAFTPTSGPLAIVGGVSLLAGILILFNSRDAPEFVRISIAGAIGITLLVTSLFAYITAKIIQSSNLQPSTGVEGLMGQTAVSRADFVDKDGRFSGTILLHGEIWRAIADSAIAAGDDVTVKSMDGFTVRVSKLEHEA